MSSAILITHPPGKVVITDGQQQRVEGSGKLCCAQPATDYVPPNTSNVSHVRSCCMNERVDTMWITSSDGTTAATRAGSTALSLRSRPPLFATSATTTYQASSMGVPAGSLYGATQYNGLTVLAFDTDSDGITGTWGPLSASWTVSLFVRCDRPVSTFGAYPGAGAMTVLSSPTAGITIGLPAGGSVPHAATLAGGGPLDGVVAGWPWDVVFVNQWRQLCVTNDAASGSRRVLVDGVLVGTQPATTGAVAAGTALTVCAHCPLAFAEFMAWNGTLTDAQVAGLRDALRSKWGVPPLPSIPVAGVIGAPAAATPASTTASAVGGVLPVSLPTPTTWLDATHLRSLWSDRAGTSAAVASGAVCRWTDRTGNGHDCLFPSASPARWGTGAALCVNGKAVVAASAPGTFATNPVGAVTSAGNYTVVAVWRVTAGGGHPFAVGTTADFTNDEWKEAIDNTSMRTMPSPGSLGAGTGSVVAALWTRAATTVTFRMAGSGVSTGYAWSAAVAGTAWAATAPTVGTANKSGLHLAELLVWSVALTTAQQQTLADYLLARWGQTFSPTATPSTLPSPTPTQTDGVQLAIDATGVSDAVGTTNNVFSVTGNVAFVADPNVTG